MAIKYNTDALAKRLQVTFDKFAKESPELATALTQIGALVIANAKMNIRRQGMIDTGRLLNSLRYEFYKTKDASGVQIGSFGVPYAAIHEYGATGELANRVRRAMFFHFARLNKPKKKGKGIVREGYIKARPYMRPAFNKTEKFSLNILRKALSLK